MTDGEQILSELKKTLAESFESLNWPSEPRGLYAPVRYSFATPGKQIRPMLALLASGMILGDPAVGLPAAKGVEILHTFTLVHDDIMDQAEKRRGQYSVFHKWDTSTAILSGDVIFARAMQSLLDYGTEKYPDLDKSQFHDIQQLLLAGITEICEGQAMDMAFAEQTRVEVSDYITMINKKTAALLAISLQLGGLAAGATSSQTDAFEQIGRQAGIAFQIQDDLLDIQAASQTSGKVRGGDLREGKMTYLTIEALKRANSKDKEWLQSSLGNRNLSEEGVLKAYELFESLSVIEDAEAEIEKHYALAQEALHSFEESSYRKGLEHLLDNLITRSF